MTVAIGGATVEIGVVNLSNSTEGGIEQFESSHPVVMPGYWRVDGDTNASGELKAGTGGWSFLGLLEVGVASVGIYRQVGSGLLSFVYGEPPSHTEVGVRIDCSVSGGLQLRSPDGSWWQLAVSNTGTLSTAAA